MPPTAATKAEQTMFGNINSGLLRQALGPISGCTSPCVPFNLFGGFGSITPAMINFVSFEQNDSSKQTQFDATANLSGNLFELPGGPLGLAIGAEYRDLKGRFDPDPVVAAGFSSDIPAQPTKGSYDVREAYAELNAPILADLPFVKLLEFNGAGPLLRLFDLRLDDDLQGRRQLQADPGFAPARQLRGRLPRPLRSANCSAPSPGSTKSSTIPARRIRATTRRGGSPTTRRSGPPASPPVSLPTAATSRPTRRSR
jgi:hypothetical protein